MQVSWSPIASWISTAATALSTPPDSPQMTRPLPTWARILRRPRSSGNAPCVQSPGRPAMRRTKLPISALAARRVHHLGVELHGVELALLVGDGRERRALRHADHLEARRQPRDAVAVAHPHRVAWRPCPRSRRTAREVPVISTSARPNSRWCPPSTPPPSCATMVCSP